jgi:hypothetical protein
MAEKEITRANDYTQLDVAKALRALALYGGNAARASKALTAEGLPVPVPTLEQWRSTTYPVEYEQIVYELRQKIGSQVSDGAMEVAVDAQQLSAEMIARLQRELHEVPAKELAKAALNMAQTSRTNIEVARLLRNEPTSITEVRSVDETLDVLRDLDVIDVEAEELGEAKEPGSPEPDSL